MSSWVIKRNGQYQPFEFFKIEDAICKAFDSSSVKMDKNLPSQIAYKLNEKEVWAVEEIQDLIEESLYQAGHFRVMKAFMLYRHTRKMQREHILGLNEDTTYIDCSLSVNEYIDKSD